MIRDRTLDVLGDAEQVQDMEGYIVKKMFRGQVNAADQHRKIGVLPKIQLPPVLLFPSALHLRNAQRSIRAFGIKIFI